MFAFHRCLESDRQLILDGTIDILSYKRYTLQRRVFLLVRKNLTLHGRRTTMRRNNDLYTNLTGDYRDQVVRSVLQG